jgi:glycosyltransferase involved in cell wall biosynthesis
MKLPLITVAVATFNGEKYLREQLDSILYQTYRNFEVIISDDCSTDSTVNIIHEYKRNNVKIKLYQNNSNIGYSGNFEKAILLGHGDYIALSDQDDIWFPEKLEILVKEIGTHSLICSDAKLIDENSELMALSLSQHNTSIADHNTVFLEYFFKKCIYGCTMMFTRELAQRAFPLPSSLYKHDWWLPIVAMKINGIKFIDDKLVLYRQHSGNTIGSSGKLNLLFRVLRFYSNNGRNRIVIERKQRQICLIQKYLSSGQKIEENEKNTLENILYYLNCFIKKKITFKCIAIAWKYKKFYLNDITELVVELLYICFSFKKN